MGVLEVLLLAPLPSKWTVRDCKTHSMQKRRPVRGKPIKETAETSQFGETVDFDIMRPMESCRYVIRNTECPLRVSKVACLIAGLKSNTYM